MLVISREVGQRIDFIDELGRRIVVEVSGAGNRKTRLSIKAPVGVAIVRPEMGAIIEAELVARARLKASDEESAA